MKANIIIIISPTKQLPSTFIGQYFLLYIFSHASHWNISMSGESSLFLISFIGFNFVTLKGTEVSVSSSAEEKSAAFLFVWCAQFEKTYHTEECAASSHAVGGQHGRKPWCTRWTPGIPHHRWDPTFNRVRNREGPFERNQERCGLRAR